MVGPIFAALVALSLTGSFAVPAAAQSGGLGGLPEAPSAPSQAAPKAVVIDPIYDFGATLSGNPIKHTFKIRNEGQGTLIIGGMTTSCGCTAAKPAKDHLAPGQETNIDATFDTRGEKGAVERTITAFTNDPKNPQVTMTLKGDVKLQVAATPQEVAFGNVRRGAELTKQVVIKDLMSDKQFKVGPVSNSNKNIKVTAPPPAGGKPGSELTVALLKTMPVGQFADTVKVETSRGPVDVLVFGTVTGDLTVNPAQVSFGIVPHHASALRIVRLTNSGAHAVKVLGVTSSNQSVVAGFAPVTPGKEYKITLELRKNTSDGQLRGMLAVKTDDPEQPTVNIPFFGIVGAFRG
ncbi:MAG: DUF1573 domain-containing protein [Candidatus Binataceae bacterium]